MRNETADTDPFPILESVLGQVVAEFRDELSAPTEPCRGHIQVFGLVLSQCLQPAVDSWAGDGIATEEQEWDEVTHHISYVADLLDLV
jgi:hypothetical protein